jgi:hypothetical protein
MKIIHLLFVLLILSASLSAQEVNFQLIKSVVSQPDSVAKLSLLASGYTPNKDGDYRFIQDNKIKAFISYAKVNPDIGQPTSYWAFQARGKKAYKPIFEEIRKKAVLKKGTHFGKPRTEYKTPDGFYFYPFEDSMFDGLYWIYASKASILDVDTK